MHEVNPLDIYERSINLKKEFNDLKKAYVDFFKTIDFFAYSELPGKRTPKIVMKLQKFPGDISPNMLVVLGKEIEENIDFYEKNRRRD